MGEVCVSTAWIWKDEDDRASDSLRLQSNSYRPTAFGKQRPEDRDTDERHDLRPVAQDFPPKPYAASDVLLGPERIDPRCRTRHDVRHAVSPFRKTDVIPVLDWFGHQASFVEQLPEPVGESREVMTGQRRPDTGVDADEQHAHITPDAIAERRECCWYDSRHGARRNAVKAFR